MCPCAGRAVWYLPSLWPAYTRGGRHHEEALVGYEYERACVAVCHTVLVSLREEVVPMTTGLADCFRYNLWANLRLLDACACLSDSQLDAPAAPGTFGSVRETLMHLFTAEEGYARHYDLPRT